MPHPLDPQILHALGDLRALIAGELDRIDLTDPSRDYCTLSRVRGYLGAVQDLIATTRPAINRAAPTRDEAMDATDRTAVHTNVDEILDRPWSLSA